MTAHNKVLTPNQKSRALSRIAQAIKSYSITHDIGLAQYTCDFWKRGTKLHEIKKTPIATWRPAVRTRLGLDNPDTIEFKIYEESKRVDTIVYNFSDVANDDSIDPNEDAHTHLYPTKQPYPTNELSGLGGLGGLDTDTLNGIIEKKVGELRKQDEYEKLLSDKAQLESRCKDLEIELEDTKEKIKAKTGTEYYMNLLGKAMPGLGMLLGGSAGKIFTQLSGVDSTDSNAQLSGATEDVVSDDRTSMINLLHDFMRDNLTTQEIATVYTIFEMFGKDKSLISTVLNYVLNFTPKPSNATAPSNVADNQPI